MHRTPQQIKNKIKLDRWWRKQQRRFRFPRELEFEVFLVLLLCLILMWGYFYL